MNFLLPTYSPLGEYFVGREVHPEKRSVSWVNNVLRQLVLCGYDSLKSQVSTVRTYCLNTTSAEALVVDVINVEK